MNWGKTHEEQKAIDRAKDLRWFAWHPIRLENGRWAWLERVSRSWKSYGWDILPVYNERK